MNRYRWFSLASYTGLTLIVPSLMSHGDFLYRIIMGVLSGLLPSLFLYTGLYMLHFTRVTTGRELPADKKVSTVNMTWFTLAIVAATVLSGSVLFLLQKL